MRRRSDACDRAGSCPKLTAPSNARAASSPRPGNARQRSAQAVAGDDEVLRRGAAAQRQQGSGDVLCGCSQGRARAPRQARWVWAAAEAVLAGQRTATRCRQGRSLPLCHFFFFTASFIRAACCGPQRPAAALPDFGSVVRLAPCARKPLCTRTPGNTALRLPGLKSSAAWRAGGRERVAEQDEGPTGNGPCATHRGPLLRRVWAGLACLVQHSPSPCNHSGTHTHLC